jgi:hypothetical protein
MSVEAKETSIPTRLRANHARITPLRPMPTAARLIIPPQEKIREKSSPPPVTKSAKRGSSI